MENETNQKGSRRNKGMFASLFIFLDGLFARFTSASSTDFRIIELEHTMPVKVESHISCPECGSTDRINTYGVERIELADVYWYNTYQENKCSECEETMVFMSSNSMWSNATEQGKYLESVYIKESPQ